MLKKKKKKTVPNTPIGTHKTQVTHGLNALNPHSG